MDDPPGELADEIDLTPSIDEELEAAIEYKLAACGLSGVGDILDLVDGALRRRLRAGGGV